MADANEVLTATVRGAPAAGYVASTQIGGMTAPDWVTVLTLTYMALLVLGQFYPAWRKDLYWLVCKVLAWAVVAVVLTWRWFRDQARP